MFGDDPEKIENKKKNAPANGKRKFIVASLDSSAREYADPASVATDSFSLTGANVEMDKLTVAVPARICIYENNSKNISWISDSQKCPPTLRWRIETV